MQTGKLMNIHFFEVFIMYSFIRAYFYLRSNGAPIEARSFLPVVVGTPLVILWSLISFSLWLIYIPVLAAGIYALVGYIKMKKGLIKADKPKIKYAPIAFEFLIVFILSLVVVKLLGFNYFIQGF
jgi:hypothetical protein